MSEQEQEESDRVIANIKAAIWATFGNASTTIH